MEPTGSGVGGDLLRLYGMLKRKNCIKRQWKITKTLTMSYFKKNNITKIPATGPFLSPKPGCVDGWFELHSKLGN
jgi:gamma-glutamyltranspeptidase/glutathione hydrolase